MAGDTFTLQSIVLISLATFVFSYTEDCVPPTIVEPQARVSYYHKENERVTISCTATGTPSPTYEWRFNDNPVSSNTITYDKVTGTLTISSLSVKEEGFFKCHASNSNPFGVSATVISQPVEIRVARVEEFKNTPPQTFSISEGNYLKLACDDAWPTYYGTTSFKWYIKKLEQSEINQDGRIFIDHEGALHFAYILKSDDVPGSTYHCAISNSAQGIIKLGRGNSLSVTRSTTTVTQQKPQLIYKNNGKSLMHTDAVLECVFSGDINSPTTLPKIRWYDDVMTEIVSGGRYNIDSYGRKMTIENVQESDEKTYSCQGSNDVGSTTEKVFLDVTSTPIWVNLLKTQTVTEGETATFNCSARSTTGENPPETPKWFKNGLNIDSYDESKYVFSLDKKTLQVKDVRKDNDYTCFQCSVSNSNGDVFANGCLLSQFLLDTRMTSLNIYLLIIVLLSLVTGIAGVCGVLCWGKHKRAAKRSIPRDREQGIITTPAHESTQVLRPEVSEYSYITNSSLYFQSINNSVLTPENRVYGDSNHDNFTKNCECRWLADSRVDDNNGRPLPPPPREPLARPNDSITSLPQTQFTAPQITKYSSLLTNDQFQIVFGYTNLKSTDKI